MLNTDESKQMAKTESLQFSKIRIIKNLFILSLVFFMTFTAYTCLSMLQSTLNHENGIGVICQAIVYGCFSVSALLLPKYVIQKLGCKLTLVLSMCFYVPYIASNLYPHWFFMIPAAVFNGLSASLLWGSQSQYLNEISVMFATRKFRVNKCSSQESAQDGSRVKNENLSDCMDNKAKNGHLNNAVAWHMQSNCLLNRLEGGAAEKDVAIKNSLASNFPLHEMPNAKSNANCNQKGALYFQPNALSLDFAEAVNSAEAKRHIQSMTARFFGIHGMAYLSSHLWSNLMSYFILQNDALHPNVTLDSNCTCGAEFCNEESECLVQNLLEPSQENRTLLTGLCIGLSLASIILLALFLDSLNDRKENVKFSLDFLLATFKHLKNKKQFFLTPISFYIGMIQGFYAGDFTMSFVGCAWGTYHVGLVSACYGAACAIASSLSGCLVKYVGRVPIFTFSGLINLASLILLLKWRPDAENPEIFFVFAGLWGTSVGVFWSQVKAMYGLFFKDEEEAAFAAYHLWYSLGYCLSFAYSNHLCTYVKIYVLMSVLICGMIGYFCVEIFSGKEIKPEK